MKYLNPFYLLGYFLGLVSLSKILRYLESSVDSGMKDAISSHGKAN